MTKTRDIGGSASFNAIAGFFNAVALGIPEPGLQRKRVTPETPFVILASLGAALHATGLVPLVCALIKLVSVCCVFFDPCLAIHSSLVCFLFVFRETRATRCLLTYCDLSGNWRML